MLEESGHIRGRENVRDRTSVPSRAILGRRFRSHPVPDNLEIRVQDPSCSVEQYLCPVSSRSISNTEQSSHLVLDSSSLTPFPCKCNGIKTGRVPYVHLVPYKCKRASGAVHCRGNREHASGQHYSNRHVHRQSVQSITHFKAAPTKANGQ